MEVFFSERKKDKYLFLNSCHQLSALIKGQQLLAALIRYQISANEGARRLTTSLAYQQISQVQAGWVKE